jgi:hypothetical protein
METQGGVMRINVGKFGMQTMAAILMVLLWADISAPAQQKPEQLAQAAAESWLVLVDNGKYAESWNQAAAYFKAAVTQDQWQKMLTTTRTPLGKMLSRKLKSATYTRTLPGAPDGEYVILQFESSFEHKSSAIETVTPMLDQDGQWRVSGYFIK